jgi:hypothetical protein
MKKYRFLKLVGIAMLTIVTLVLISFIEVAVYSYVINPGQEMSIYDEHANVSAPWISGIFGFIVFFLVVRYWAKKKYESLLKLSVLFVLAYITLDLIILIAFGVNWAEFHPIVLMANGAKLTGSLTAYYFYRPKAEGS